MKIKLTSIILVLAISSLPNLGVNAQRHSPPRFGDYPVREIFRGAPAKVNLRSSPGAGYYRTRLREGAKSGANFAGHYTIIIWGCGSDCFDIAVVDARNGNVYFAPFTGALGLDYRLNSKLLIVDPKHIVNETFPNGSPYPVDEIYFLWEGNRFVQLYPKNVKPLPAIR